MKLLLCLTSLISLVFASDVLQYSGDDFASMITTHDLALVEFFTPGCDTCKVLDEAYEEAARILKVNNPPVPVIKVDCTVDSGICDEFGVQTYPSFQVFRNGEAEDYIGQVTTEGFVKYMKNRAEQASKEVKTVEAVENILEHNDYFVIGFFSDIESELAKSYQKVADALKQEIFFAHTTEQAVRDKYNYNDVVVLFQPKIYQNEFEEPARVYNDEATVPKITDWIQKQRLGLCSERTEHNADKFRKPLVVVYYDVKFSENKTDTIDWRHSVLKVAKKFQDAGKEVNFAVSSHKIWVHELGTFGLTKTINRRPVFTPRDKPVVTARDTRERKYVMSEEFSEENLEKFVNDMLDGKLEQYLKSQPIPDSNDEPVKVVVAKSFDQIVNNEDKDVLIQLYAPWSSLCTTFQPKYEELAEKLKNETELTIAKMDATMNELPKSYGYLQFPVIYFAPKGNKNSPKLYSGALEVDDLIQFIAKESTNGIKEYNRK